MQGGILGVGLIQHDVEIWTDAESDVEIFSDAGSDAALMHRCSHI